MADSATLTDWTELELAYLAGILDGEGSIGVRLRHHSKTGRPYYDYQVCVGQVDARLIEWLHGRFGGTRGLDTRAHRKHGNANPLHLWVVSGRVGEPILAAVLPFLKLKHRQAELVLRLRDSIRLGNNQFSEVLWAERQAIHEEMRALNRRGRAVT